MADVVETVVRAIDESTDVFEHIGESAEGMGEQIEEVADSNRETGASFTELNSAMELAEKGVQFFKQAFDFSKEGAAIQRIGEQFNATVAEFGVSGDALIAKLDKVAGRTVDDEELMRIATRAFTQEVVGNADELAKLLEIARASAVRFGGDTASAFERISLATETGMVRSLKMSGIMLDLEQVYKDYAETLGKTRKELTQQEEKQARLNAVLAEGAKLVEKVGDAVDDNLSKFQRFERQMGDLGDELKLAAVDGFTPVLDRIEAVRVLTDKASTATEKLGAAVLLNNDFLSGYQGRLNNLIPELQAAADAEAAFQTRLAELTSVEEDRISGMQHLADTADFLTQREQELTQTEEENAQAAKIQEESQKRVTDALNAARDAANEAVQSFASLSEEFNKDFDAADVAKKAINLLNDELDARKITPEEYARAVKKVQLEYGLASEASIAMAEGLETVTRLFGEGKIKEDVYTKALGLLEGAAKDGKVMLDELGISIVGVAGESAIASDKVGMMGDDVIDLKDKFIETTEYAGKFRDELAQIPPEVRTNIIITTQGSIPNIPVTGAVPAQRGMDVVIPPGFPADSFFLPLRVSSGERVTVQPRNQQAGGQNPVLVSGDTVIINDRLALAQYYEQKRARWIERGAARMR